VPAELAGGYPGDVFRYTVTITNTGEEPLSLVTLTDDLAPAGGAVRNVTASTDHTWMADGSNPVYLDLGDLAPGESVTLTYEYTSVEADIELVKINTAHVIATATVTMNNDEPLTVEDEDTAAIAVDEIPQTGESGTWPAWGIGLLMAALGLTVLRRRSRKGEQKA
ncbi:MAG: LPXTG cell wall anchor domain-containing protein, partial [Bacillota bacterium]|nr:LPXTG cell wall anchor domain-containing protein [Bacillota bacterium]